MGGGGVGAGLLQHGRRGFAGPLWTWPGQGWPGVPCCHVRSATTTSPGARTSRTSAGEVVPSRLASVWFLPSLGASFRPPWPRGGVRSGAAWMCPRPWWRVLAGGLMVGWPRFEWVAVLGDVGEIFASSSGSDAVTPEGAIIPS